jgi:hypothetical protein
LEANYTFIGSTGLPSDYPIGIRQNKISIRTKGEWQLGCVGWLPKPH